MIQHPVLETRQLTKSFKNGPLQVEVLRDINLQIHKSELVGIIGPSGSGKSTLLGIIGGLDSPTTGNVYIDGLDITNLNENRLTEIRNEKIGFVFQSFNLIPSLTALQNVALPIRFAKDASQVDAKTGKKKKVNPTERAKYLLEVLGMGDRLKHRPSQLSGGQQQRVAIARALANDPSILLADEPTGNLDTASGEVVLKAFKDIREALGTTVVVITHDKAVASQLDRLINIVDGEIVPEAVVEGHL